MITNEDIEKYLIEIGVNFETIKENFWIVQEDDFQGAKIVIYHDFPTITFRVKLMEIPETNREQFFKKLLELNSSAMISGAFGVEGNNVVIVENLQSENLDLNEFEAAIESLAFAITDHFKELSSYRKQSN